MKEHFFTLILAYESQATVDAWVKDSRNAVSRSQIHLAFTVRAPICGNKQAALLREVSYGTWTYSQIIVGCMRILDA